jgi:sugar (pentulose or hexulose) kinase
LTRNEVLLGIDVGTTYSKAVALSFDGAERGWRRVRSSWKPVPTGAEIEPESLIENALAAARGALSAADGGRVAGVGVTSMAETGVLLDAAGSPLVPAIVWHDTRGDDQARALESEVGADEFTARTGLRVSRMCTAVKYRWMRENWPDASRGVRWLNVAEWVARGLGGDEKSEPSLASRTGWLDIGRREPWEAALEWSQAPPGLLPDPAPAGASAGRVGSRFSDAGGATIAIAGHDHLCASIGAGATDPGDVFDSCGTAESFVRALEPPVEPAELLRANRGRVSIGCHVLPEHLAAMGGFESGLALQRILDLFGHSRLRDRLDERALAVAPGAGGVEIHGITEDEVAIRGIGREATSAHLWRAALEAVQRRGAEVLETLESIGGPRRRLVATGGGLQNEAVRRVKREILGTFVEPAVKEAGARGAALLAGMAAGIYPDIASLPETRWKEPVGA